MDLLYTSVLYVNCRILRGPHTRAWVVSVLPYREVGACQWVKTTPVIFSVTTEGWVNRRGFDSGIAKAAIQVSSQKEARGLMRVQWKR